jgi:hypothetical protein
VKKKDFTVLAVVAQIGAALAAAHGLKSKRWTLVHTTCVLVGAMATIGRVLWS